MDEHGPDILRKKHTACAQNCEHFSECSALDEFTKLEMKYSEKGIIAILVGCKDYRRKKQI